VEPFTLETKMGNNSKNLLLLAMLTPAFGSILPNQATAQTFTTLYSFTASSGFFQTNNDGRNPVGGLSFSWPTLYGTTANGGVSGAGAVFRVNTDGAGFTRVYSFAGGSDGASPNAGLTLSGSTVYGTTAAGGSSGAGTVFKVNTDGTGFTNLYTFTSRAAYTNSDGAVPIAGLVLSNNVLYGTSAAGGASGYGTVFKLNADGTGFSNLHNFGGSALSDGSFPHGGLVLSSNTLYGTATQGGTANGGTVFAVSTDGTGFTNLHTFLFGDGITPYGALVLSSNTLYGTAAFGGSSSQSYGTVFAVNTDGTGFRTVYNFTGGNDGARPYAGLILSGNMLFGTATQGGSSRNGTVFTVNTDGTGFTTLHAFGAASGNIPFATNNDGLYPIGDLLLSGGTLYATAEYGGRSGSGTVFSLVLGSGGNQPQLALATFGANIVLMWPGNDTTGFALQSTTTLGSSAVWTTNFPAPAVVNGQNTVTNPISGTQQFFRLSR
jgi:uncharacterized repeat protein (TIGR03803 family)